MKSDGACVGCDRNYRLWECASFVLSLLALYVLSSCETQSAVSPRPSRDADMPKISTVSAPDMTQYTRVEIQFLPSALDYLFLEDARENFLTPKEIEYVQSLDRFVITDEEALTVLAREISLGSYNGHTSGVPAIRDRVAITCYQGTQAVAQFMLYGHSLITDAGHQFEYDEGLASFNALTAQLDPFRLRARCSHNLATLWTRLPNNGTGAYSPPPKRWCDAIVSRLRDDHLDKDIMMAPFRCPAVYRGQSTYALNPECRRNSPSDTVLLFETTPGWNEHGGPELFTFDNHNPRGGCVILRNGTVKFIRTEEELKQLRWK